MKDKERSLTRAVRQKVTKLWLMLHKKLSRFQGAGKCSICLPEIKTVVICALDLKAFDLQARSGFSCVFCRSADQSLAALYAFLKLDSKCIPLCA